MKYIGKELKIEWKSENPKCFTIYELCGNDKEMITYATNLFWRKGVKKYVKQLLRIQKHPQRNVKFTAYRFVSHFYIESAYKQIVKNIRKDTRKNPYFKKILSYIKRRRNDLLSRNLR